MKVVRTVARGAASSNRIRLPVWSRSSWVSQIQRRSEGRMTDSRALRNWSPRTAVPASKRTGSVESMTKAFIGMTPAPGTGQ
jgi:hypothetical protein